MTRVFDTELQVLRDAKPGDTPAMADLYAMLALALRGGHTLPSELADWLADRLTGISEAMAAAGKKGVDPATLARATWASSGVAGAKKRNEVESAKRRFAVWEVFYIKRENVHGATAMKKAAKMWGLTEAQVADAYKHRAKEFPDEDWPE